MKHKLVSLLISLVISLTCNCKQPEDSTFRIYAYLPDYRPTSDLPLACDLVTDVMAFSAEIDPASVPFLSSTRVKLAGMDRILSRDVMEKARAVGGCRFSLVVGGGGRSGSFAELAGTASSSRALANTVANAARNSGFDGVSYDWEYPNSNKQWDAYARLLKFTRAALGDDMTLSMAVHPSRDTFIAMKRLRLTTLVDMTHIMAYDSPLGAGQSHSSVQLAHAIMEHLTASGISPGALSLGVPFYGRKTTGALDAKTYEELRRDGRSFDPSLDFIDGYAFNSVRTLREKVRAAKAFGFGGVMIWELGQDVTPYSRADSLLLAVASEACGESPVRGDEL